MKAHKCAMDGCTNQISVMSMFCTACRAWHAYWTRRPLAAWAKYGKRLSLARNRREGRTEIRIAKKRRNRALRVVA